jgi:hypothetical protein
MGRRGPKPKANILKFLAGNPHKAPLDMTQPTMPPPEDEFLKPPKRLKGAGLKEWMRLIVIGVERGIIHSGNITMFTRYCMVTMDLVKIENVSAKMAIESAASLGLLREASRLTQQQRQLARDLRITELAGDNVTGKNEKGSELSAFLT